MLSRNQGTIWTTLNGCAGLLDVEVGGYYELNAVGTVLWDFLAEPRTVDDLVDHLVARYQVTREQCQADVAAFLDALRARGLLVEDANDPVAVPGRSASE